MNSHDLFDRLRLLIDHAEHDGADRVWLNETADHINAALLGLRLDPRTRRSLADADRLGIAYLAMRRADHSPGAAIAALCRRNDLSRSRVYALLNMSRHFTRQNKG